MKQNSKHLFLLILFLTILVMGSLTYLNWPRCTQTEFVDASVSVKTTSKTLLGFNTDTSSLTFGAVSPGAQVVRSINTQYNHNSQTQITIEGELASWLTIDPNNFFLLPSENKLVSFTLNVPQNALDGDYTSKVKFCFRK